MGKIDFSDLGLQTQKGRDAARKRLTAYARTHTFSELSQVLLDTEIAEDSRIQTLGTLLNDLDMFSNSLERPHPTVIHWDDIAVTDREWLIPNWLPANTATLFTGDGGVGKSWLTLQVVCQIACGFNNAFLNPAFPLPSEADDSIEPKHVIFATYEDEPEEIKRRIQALASGMNWIAASLETLKHHLHIVDMRGIGSVWGPGMGNHIANTGDLLFAGEAIRAICEERNAKLLVMDPLSGAFGGNENDRTAVYDFVSSFRGWGDAAKCAMLVIGHLPKGAEGRASGFSGSTAWEASIRSMWRLSKQNAGNSKNPEEYWALLHTKSNYAPLHNEKPLIKSRYGWWQAASDVDEALQAYKDYQATLEKEQEDEDIDPEIGF